MINNETLMSDKSVNKNSDPGTPKLTAIRPKIVHIFHQNPSGTNFTVGQQGPPFQVKTVNFSRLVNGAVIHQTVNAINEPVVTPAVSLSSPNNPTQCVKRPFACMDSEFYRRTFSSLREKTKGLRHFSMKVCEKVKQKRVTTYNEVADELVQEYCSTGNNMNQGPDRCDSPNEVFYDQKNIRRRVYDAINVLMAMNIISKERKEIKWIGFPSNAAHECELLEKEKSIITQNLKDKSVVLRELLLQHVCMKKLMDCNKQRFKNPVFSEQTPLPIVVARFPKDTYVECYVSTDKKHYALEFEKEFQLYDDLKVLLNLGYARGLDNGTCSADELSSICSLLPRMFEPYLKQMAISQEILPIYDLKDKILSLTSNSSKQNLMNENCATPELKDDISSSDEAEPSFVIDHVSEIYEYDSSNSSAV